MSKMPRWMKQDLDIALPALGISDEQWYPDVTVHRLLDLLLEGLTPGQRHTLALQGATIAAGSEYPIEDKPLLISTDRGS